MEFIELLLHLTCGVHPQCVSLLLQTNTRSFLSCLCFILFFINSLELITTAKGNPSFVLTNEIDHQALLAIKDLIQGDSLGALSSWNHSIHFCNWQRVSCGRRHQCVALLNLSSLALVSSISPQIGNLTFLRRIHLGNNSFHGKIPQELGKLFRLQYLQLVNNSFQGGKIPIELGSLSNLSTLNLTANHLTGTIPLSIGNLSNLRVLCLAFNNLQGSIPTQLGKLSKLEVLQLSVNNLSGMVPTSLYNISSIYFFSINDNQLHGILPPDLGLTLPNLLGFYVDSNQFYGQIPLSIENATKLVQIDFGNNSFTGSMPKSLGRLDALEIFAANNNSLGTNQVNELTTFLTSLSNCSNLRILVLASNQFKGFLPHSIANLSIKITWLILQDNYISGSIPLGIGNLVHLQYLFLDDNMITGSIPNSIGKLSMLEILMVDKNNISGEIPSSIRNPSRLGTLDLSTNMIEGSIPISLGHCTNLQQIHLDYNHLIGAIPYQIFGLSSLIILSLGQNYIIGLLSQEVGEFHFFQFLNLSYNMFDGEVPNGGVFTNISAFSVVGNGKVCGGIEVLQLPACSMEVLNERKRPFNLRVIVLIVTPTIVLLSLCILAIIYRNKRFSPSNLIGEGGYGSVYKGILNSDEQIVAVQVLKLHECGANKTCSSIDFKGNNFKALVFEFMENVLHEPKNLNFVQRLNIAIDVACALDYLHHHCEMAFIHCDLKPSNILLDGDLCAHVSDFGLAKIFSATNGISSHQQSSSIGIRGTIGYVAPEYGMGEEASTQGDMYGYGVLLLEMLIGKGPTSNMFTGNVNLHSYVKMCLLEKVMQIVDPQIILKMEVESSKRMKSSTINISKLETCLVPVFHIGVSCSAEMPSERMTVKDVLKELHKIRNLFLGVRGQRHLDGKRNDS
ncbi:hypothetical protein ACSBR1_041196 [Camellia fascicularis]